VDVSWHGISLQNRRLAFKNNWPLASRVNKMASIKASLLMLKKEPKMERQKAGSYHQTVIQAKRLKLAKACGLRNDG